MDIKTGHILDKLKNRARAMGVPLVGQFELTARCNNICKMCYVCKSAGDRQAVSKEYSARKWIDLAEKARDEGMFYVLLTGGEVFLRRDFMEIYNELSMMGLRIIIYTNATMVTQDIAKQLGRIPPSRVEVTLYGASAETYNKVCKNPWGFDQAMRGIDLLQAEGIDLELRTTVIRDNASDYDKIAELADERNVTLKIVDYISPRRDGTNLSDNLRLSAKELMQFKKHAQENYTMRKKNLFPDKFSDSSTRENSPINDQDKHPFKCYAGRSEFWVTWDGKMTPCGMIEEPVTLPFEKGFAAAWNELKNACASIPVCIECSECSFINKCFSCPARLKIETGYFDKPAPYFCEFAKEENKSQAY